jgi:hypothetical protein
VKAFLLLATVLSVTTAYAQSSLTPMPVDEHYRLVVGNTEVGKNDTVGDFAVYTSPDGKRKVRVTSPEGKVVLEDEGTLRIQDGAYCIRWNKIDEGREVCGVKIFRDGDQFRSQRPDGTGNLHHFEAGNSRGL